MSGPAYFTVRRSASIRKPVSFSGSKMWSFFTSVAVRTGSGRFGPLSSSSSGQAHSFGGDEDVRENDDGVDVEAPKRLNRDFDCQIRSLADLQERMLCTDFPVFRKVAPGLAHHPDRKARNGLATASAQKQFFASRRGGLGSHKYGSRIANRQDSCLCVGALNF